MGEVVIGDCRLCGAKGVRLLDSHIVSKAAYKRLLKGRPGEPVEQQPVIITGDGAVLSNEQMTQHLLCESCEQRFCVWEGYAFPLLCHADATFPWLANVVKLAGVAADSSALDVDKLSLFAISLFWRFSVSHHTDVRLGSYEPEFRAYLLGRAAFPQAAALAIALLDPANATIVDTDRGFCTFKSARVDGYHSHRFALFGVDMHLLVGQAVPAGFRRAAFVRSKIVAIRPLDSYMAEMLPHVHKSPAKGSLAKRQL